MQKALKFIQKRPKRALFLAGGLVVEIVNLVIKFT